MLGRHIGIPVNERDAVVLSRSLREALDRVFSRPVHPLAHRGRRLAVSRRRQLVIAERRNFDLNVDAVEQRTAYLREVFLAVGGLAGTLAVRVAVMTALAGIHRRDEHK